MAILTEALIPLETSLKNYRVQVEALNHYLPSVLASVAPGKKSVSPLFDEMTEDEVIKAFFIYNNEAGYSSILAMLASMEAFIRTDFSDKRKKSGRFRSLYSQNSVKARRTIFSIYGRILVQPTVYGSLSIATF
jgi:hypothetical protein